MLPLDAESHEEDNTRRALPCKRKRKCNHTRHKETPTTRDSPFYCTHHHFIYSPFYITSWVLIQINSLLLRHFTLSAKSKRRGEFCRFPTPFYQIQRGGGKEERGRVHPLGRKAVVPQPNAVQDINSQGFFKGRLR